MGELKADREVLVSARLSPGWRLQLSVTFAEGPDYNLFFDLVDLTDIHTLISPSFTPLVAIISLIYPIIPTESKHLKSQL